MDSVYPGISELKTSITTTSDVYNDSGYTFEVCSQSEYFPEHYEEKPPLTALGEVIELIGQPWIHQHQQQQQWTSSTVFQSFDTKTEYNLSELQLSTVITCNICHQTINEQFLVKIDNNFYHENCSRCCICSETFNDKCYEKDGSMYCSSHYYSGFSPFKCSGCGYGVAPNDMVYKLKDDIIYHVKCHSCFICGKELIPGEKIVVNDTTKAVSCSKHQKNQQNIDSREKSHSINQDLKPLLTSAEKKDKTKAKNIADNILQNIGVIPQYPFEMYAFGEMCSDDSRFMKRRGPRTTIKQSQLDVLNQIFSSTPKPSKHARAKLALETGLSMRVIQVWFQNRRSKERRLKHLCNFLRHYEQKGLMPPSFNFNPEDGTLMGEPLSPSILQSFNIDNMDDQFTYEDDNLDDEISN